MDIDDLDPDPIVQFGRWLDDYIAAGPPEPTAVVLSTTGSARRPSARSVLLRGFGPEGFVWFTNYQSRKGSELAENPYACLLFPWVPMRRQVTVTGPVEQVPVATSDAYFATRERGSQLGAWASDQSRVIPNRAWLDDRLAEVDARFPTEVPRPPHWGGYRLVPDAIEFWQGRPNRLHDRLRYTADQGGGWRVDRLAP